MADRTNRRPFDPPQAAAHADQRRRKLRSFGLRESEEVVDLVDLCARLEHQIEYGGGSGGSDDDMSARDKLTSLRAGMGLLLEAHFGSGDDFFIARGEDEATLFRAIRKGSAVRQGLDKHKAPVI